jgi:hypothetical protein
MDGKIGQRVCIMLCVKVGKSGTDTLEMLLKKAFLAGQRFLKVFKFQGRSSVS